MLIEGGNQLKMVLVATAMCCQIDLYMAHLLCVVEVMVIRRALHDVKLLETKRIIRPLPIRAVAAPIQTHRWYEAIFGVGIVVTTFSVGAVVLV